MRLPISLRLLGSPRGAYLFCRAVQKPTVILTVLLLTCGVVWSLFIAPPDARQGDVYRIMFVHVPAAFCAEGIYVFMSLAAGVYLIWNMKLAGFAVRAAAPLGLGMALITLGSGSIWGKPTWGAYWVWDARLTSVLLLAVLYMIIIYLHRSLNNSTAAARASSVVTLVGLINIPVIKFSVNWWFSLHQPASLTLGGFSMPAVMWMPLLTMILAFNLFWLTVFFIRLGNEILISEGRAKWVQEVIKR